MGSDLPPSPASGTRAFSRPGTVAAILVGCLGLAEFGVVAGGITGAHAVDDMAVELAGTVSAIGALAVLLVVGWWHRVPRASAFQAVSGIVALVLLGGVVTWLTWLGQPAWDSPVGVNPDQSRLIAVVVADVCFGSWLMVARLVSPAPRPPAMGLAAVVLLAGAVGQVGSVIAWMNPALMAGPAGGGVGPAAGARRSPPARLPAPGPLAGGARGLAAHALEARVNALVRPGRITPRICVTSEAMVTDDQALPLREASYGHAAWLPTAHSTIWNGMVRLRGAPSMS